MPAAAAAVVLVSLCLLTLNGRFGKWRHFEIILFRGGGSGFRESPRRINFDAALCSFSLRTFNFHHIDTLFVTQILPTRRLFDQVFTTSTLDG